MKRTNCFVLWMTLLLAGLLLSCQASASPTLTSMPPTASSLSGGETSTASVAPVITPTGIGVPILGIPGAQAAFRPVDVQAQPIQVVQVLKQIISTDPTQQDGVLVDIENPNQNLAIIGTQCQITGYDAGGAVTETSSFCDLGTLFPGEQRTLYRYIFNHGSTPATRLDFQITQQGKPAETNLSSDSLSTENIHYWPDRGEVTGVVLNHTDYIFTNPLLTTALYDAQGNLLAISDISSVSFVPPRGKAAFTAAGFSNLNLAKVDVTVEIGGNSDLKPLTAGVSTLHVNNTFLIVNQAGYNAQVYFSVTNPNSDRSLSMVDYQVFAYDAQGQVLEATQSKTPLIFPGEKTIIAAPEIGLSSGKIIDHVEVQVSPFVQEFQALDYHVRGLDQNPLSIENCQYQSGDSSMKCILKNSSNNKPSIAVVTVLGFDGSGNVVWASSARVMNVPVNGQENLTIPVYWATVGNNRTPVTIEAHANVEGLLP